jgi:hypothetical protein
LHGFAGLANLSNCKGEKLQTKFEVGSFPQELRNNAKTNNFQAAALALELITPYQATNPQFTED